MPGRRRHSIKWDRCVEEVRGTAVSPYAVCTAKLGRRGYLKNHDLYLLYAMAHHGGPLMYFTGARFADFGRALPFKSPDSAMQAAKFLIEHTPKLAKYALSVVRVKQRLPNPVPLLALVGHVNTAKGMSDTVRGKNPARVIERNEREIDLAADRLESFTGMEPHSVTEISDPNLKADKVGLVIGRLDGVPYTTTRAGKSEHYLHEFKKSARPLLVASPDGREMRIVGGRFQFTEAGFVDDE